MFFIIDSEKKTWSLQPPLYTLFEQNLVSSIEEQQKMDLWEHHFSEYGRLV